jgi:hypothetical protein
MRENEREEYRGEGGREGGVGRQGRGKGKRDKMI